MIKGGSYIKSALYQQNAPRHFLSPTTRYLDLGFRCALPGTRKAVWQNDWPVMYVENFTYSLYSAEKKYWDNSGNLLSRTTEDATGKVLSSWSATYDNRGNMLTETQAGNLTGQQARQS